MDWKQISVLVTGGAGFIGNNLVRALLDRGARVRVLDDFSTGRRSNLEDMLDRIELLEGSVSSGMDCARACAGMHFVLHEAAIPSVARSVADPARSNAANIDGALNILIAARDAGVKRVVYAASSSAYGDTPTLPKHEEMPPRPMSPYALQKFAGESYCRLFSSLYGLDTVGLRYFNIFGPRQDPKSEYSAVIPKFTTLMLNGQAPTIFGDGQQSRDFTHIDNVIFANLQAIACADRLNGEVMNIACGERYSLIDLVNILNQILGTRIEPRFAPGRPGDVKHSLADISKAKRLIGYEVKTPFREGIRQAVEWYRSHPSA
ncbi:MAG: UDP-N-acetylglucosamine 4-epimerase [Myxococcota bacterium]|nr:UDP-N-acetylglucosamine 4-epimerase [Myxococcota bacterium]